MNKLLSIKNLSKIYYSQKDAIKAIDDISFDVYETDFISVVGPSGCGKSTLLNILTNMDSKTSGTITTKNNLKFGYMLQSEALLDWRTLKDNVLLGLEITNTKTKENVDYVMHLVENYGLKDFLNKYPRELSGGMRQRASLIRTLALKPDILILDEPFSKLDYQSALRVSCDVLKILKQEKKTAIMVTHDLAQAISLSNKVIVLANRPSYVKNIYEIKREKEGSPIENRKDKYFSYYYDLIWKDLENE